jgi:hypothetical protein
MALEQEREYCWVTQDRGLFMKKFNTYAIYSLGQRIGALTNLVHREGMTTDNIFLPLIRAELALKAQVRSGFFSPSLKRSAGVVLRAIYALGIPEDDSPPEPGKTDTPLEKFQINFLSQKAKDFETILANELPALATYSVSPKGIFSTDDLITNAELQVPETYRPALSEKAKVDIQQAGKCLAFELPTASAFHMWRSVESVMDSYHGALTTKSFADAGITRNWGAYIKALEAAKAEEKTTVFLDHIREEYRNPISHPNEMLELDEAFALFGPALSVIGQMLKEIVEIPKRKAMGIGLADSPPKAATAS